MTCVSHSRARKTPYTVSKMYSANGHAIHICQVAQATLETMLLYEGTVSVSYGLARMEQHTTCVCSITDNSEWLIIAGMVGAYPRIGDGQPMALAMHQAMPRDRVQHEQHCET